MTRYDLIVGMGKACSCSMSLRKAGLQHLSLPFDWMRFNDEELNGVGDLRIRAELVANGFRDWFEKENLVFNRSFADKDIYTDGKLHIEFNHEFLRGSALDEAYPAVRAKHDRRIARLYRLIDAAQSVLLVRIDPPRLVPLPPPRFEVPTTEEDCRSAREVLRRRFPGKRIDVLLLTFAPGVAYADRDEREVDPGFVRISFDYKDRRPGVPDWDPDYDLVSGILRDRYAVRDYRTADERRKHDRPRGMRRLWQALAGICSRKDCT